jgi:hypothetical protein
MVTGELGLRRRRTEGALRQILSNNSLSLENGDASFFSFTFPHSCVIIFEVANLVISLLTTLTLLFSTTAQNIEQAFLQNSPKKLHSLLSTHSHINISLPPPISFSDQLSNQQAYFLFRRILRNFSTSGFFADQKPASISDNSFIIKARWSFKDRQNNMYVFLVFFYFLDEPERVKEGLKHRWKIAEIKAESENY